MCTYVLGLCDFEVMTFFTEKLSTFFTMIVYSKSKPRLEISVAVFDFIRRVTKPEDDNQCLLE